MKKSEMVSLIEESLLAAEFLGVSDLLSHRAIAEGILFKITKLGMLPPAYHFDQREGECLCTMRESCIYCDNYGMDLNEWEKEDGE